MKIEAIKSSVVARVANGGQHRITILITGSFWVARACGSIDN